MFPDFDVRARFCEITLPDDPRLPDGLPVAQRFPRLIGQPNGASAVFTRQAICVVGTGSIGRRIAISLARLRPARLWLVDPDRYDDPANLVTQDIVVDDLGHMKAERTGVVCKQISPTTQVFIYDGRLQDLDPISMHEVDVVFLATDNLVVEVDASRIFRLLGIPIVQASTHGESLVIQVRFVANDSPRAPCLVCAFGSEERRYLNQASVFSCTGGRGRGTETEVDSVPTASISSLCSMAANFAVIQWTRHSLGVGQSVANTLLQYCGFTHRTTQVKLCRNAHCAGTHLVLRRICLRHPIAEHSPNELHRCAALDSGKDRRGNSLTLAGLIYVKAAMCRCASHDVEQFVPAGSDLGHCPTCSEPITPQPFYSSRPTPCTDLRIRRHRPLKDLGVTTAGWAVVQNGDRAALLIASPSGNSFEHSYRGHRHEV